MSLLVAATTINIINNSAAVFAAAPASELPYGWQHFPKIARGSAKHNAGTENDDTHACMQSSQNSNSAQKQTNKQASTNPPLPSPLSIPTIKHPQYNRPFLPIHPNINVHTICLNAFA